MGRRRLHLDTGVQLQYRRRLGAAVTSGQANDSAARTSFLDWHRVDDEVHAQFNELLRGMGAFLEGA